MTHLQLNDDEEEDFLSGQHKKEEEPFQGKDFQTPLVTTIILQLLKNG